MKPAPKAIFRRRAIPACRKTEIERNFKIDFRGLQNAGQSHLRNP
jgi:hypothetical protein